MDTLREHDARMAAGTDPGEKLIQALALARDGLELQRTKFRSANPGVSERELRELMARWMARD